MLWQFYVLCRATPGLPVLTRACRSACVRQAYKHCLGIKSMAFSPSAQFLALGSFDEKCRVLNHLTWSPIATYDLPRRVDGSTTVRCCGCVCPSLTTTHLTTCFSLLMFPPALPCLALPCLSGGQNVFVEEKDTPGDMETLTPGLAESKQKQGADTFSNLKPKRRSRDTSRSRRGQGAGAGAGAGTGAGADGGADGGGPSHTVDAPSRYALREGMFDIRCVDPPPKSTYVDTAAAAGTLRHPPGNTLTHAPSPMPACPFSWPLSQPISPNLSLPTSLSTSLCFLFLLLVVVLSNTHRAHTPTENLRLESGWAFVSGARTAGTLPFATTTCRRWFGYSKLLPWRSRPCLVRTPSVHALSMWLGWCCVCVRVCVCVCVCVCVWSGVEWSGVEWSGVEWSGVLCGSWRLHVPPPHARMPATPQYTRTLSEPSSGALREHDWP